MNSIIEVKNVTYEYSDEDNTFAAVKNLSLDIERGSFTVILGHNGSGKSTLLNRLTGALVVEATVAGALMPMLPGLAMTNAVQDTMRGDMVSGISSAVSAVMTAVLLAVGALAGTAFLRLLTGGAA